MLGRLTLNPLPHIDPVQSILIPGVMFFATSGRFVFGGAKPGAPGVAKTLKCGECGTLNRPTEWYCERCGAELAGI
jgi:hypothetical protein